MLTSGVAIVQDNSAHGEDNYLVRTIGEQAFLDAIMDGVTRRGGKQATQWVADALAAATLTSPGDLVAVLEQVNLRLYERGGGGFLLTTVSVALCLHGKLSVAGVGDTAPEVRFDHVLPAAAMRQRRRQHALAVEQDLQMRFLPR